MRAIALKTEIKQKNMRAFEHPTVARNYDTLGFTYKNRRWQVRFIEGETSLHVHFATNVPQRGFIMVNVFTYPKSYSYKVQDLRDNLSDTEDLLQYGF